MTACRNKASRAVTAALVGALSVGAVPMVAMAATTDAGASMMATEDAAVARAEVEYRGGEPATEFTYNGRAQGPIPTKVTPVNEDTERVTLNPWNTDTNRVKDSFYYWYVKIDGSTVGTYTKAGVQYRNDKGTLVDLKGTDVTNDAKQCVRPTEQGEYAVVIGQFVSAGNWKFVGVADTFEIVGQSLDAAVLCDGEDATDTAFNYDGVVDSTKVSEILERVHVALDGRVLDSDGKDDPDVKGDEDDVTLELWEKGGTRKIDPATNDVEIAIGQTYVVKVKGVAGSAYEGQEIQREFTLGELNLSDAVVLGVVKTDTQPSKDLTNPQPVVSSIDGATNLNWDGLNDGGALKLEFVSDPKGGMTSGGDVKGSYTYRLSAPASNKNVEGSCEFTVDYADYKAAISFGNEDFEDDDPYVVDLSADKVNYFDLDDITVKYNDGTEDKVVADEGYTVTVTDAEGNEGDLTKPGTYTVLVDVDWETPEGKVVMGSKMAKVVVSYKVTQAKDVFLSYDGQNVDESAPYPKTYNGADHVPHFSVVVKSGSKTLVEGTDYEVSYQKLQDDGKVVDVDSIVDAGYYNVVVKGLTFSEVAVFPFDVNPVELGSDNVRVAHTYVEAGKPALAHTGDVIEASFEYLSDGEWVALPADLYDVEFVRDVDNDQIDETVELKDLGDYKAYLTTADGVVNYDIDATEELRVTDTKVFADVQNDQWYSEYVYKASDPKYLYMTGYKGTKFFGPADSIKRGDVAVVLYKMAGLYKFNNAATEPGTGYDTPFSDVDSNDYWAEAIKWAADLGIVSGDGSNGGQTFRPNDTVTREELAKMLYRYMELQGKTDDVDVDAVLAEYEDESSVSDWARTYVAWLVEQGVMGQDSGLKGNQAISRAEVAAMAVRLQPDGRLSGTEDFLTDWENRA